MASFRVNLERYRQVDHMGNAPIRAWQKQLPLRPRSTDRAPSLV